MMIFTLGNFGILFGLAALAIPIILHLLQHRRFETRDWGAMQFLPESITTQKRRWLDELLLLAVRLGTVALIVLALASPFSTSPWFAALSEQPTRDVVLVLDGSYSMGLRLPDQPTPWSEALRSAGAIVDQAGPRDRLAILIAKEPLDMMQGEFSSGPSELNGKLGALPPPRANPDMPRALAHAWKLLQEHSQAARKEIVVLTDRQHFGWADLDTLAALDRLGIQWRSDAEQAKTDGRAMPSLRVSAVGPELPKSLPNYALGPLTTARGVARLGQKVTFQSALHLDGFEQYARPRGIQIVIDGKTVRELALPDKIDLKQGQIPLRFEHRFDAEGTHEVAVKLDADAAADVLPGDNEQRATIAIVKTLPILVVDGDRDLSAESSSFFVQRALGAQATASPKLPAALEAVEPAVVVLSDVPRLDAEALAALERFVAAGGGLLVAVGARVARDRAFSNEQLYRQGHGLLPAKLLEVAAARDGVRPEPSTFLHPALELFRTAADSSLAQVRFPRWWRTKPGVSERANVMATFSNGDPLLLEKAYQRGRVILCTVPLDRRWDSTLPSTWEFPILMHELAYYLAGNRDAALTPALDGRESNLKRCSDDDWRKVRERLPVHWHTDATSSASVGDAGAARHDLWWLLLVGVLGLLCLEVWLTRRLAHARGYS